MMELKLWEYKYKLRDKVVFIGITPSEWKPSSDLEYGPYYNRLAEVINLPGAGRFYEVEFYENYNDESNLLLYEEEIEFPASQYLLSTI